jgi:hypothetical protein
MHVGPPKGFKQALLDLMQQNKVTFAVASKGPRHLNKFY